MTGGCNIVTYIFTSCVCGGACGSCGVGGSGSSNSGSGSDSSGSGYVSSVIHFFPMLSSTV